MRRTLRATGAPVRSLLTGLIRVYRVTLSGWLGGQCRFYPTCSRYAEEAIQAHGAVRGTGMAIWRVLRCNPFGTGGVEPVTRGAAANQYEAVIPNAQDRVT